jgi:hypothetical protein
MLGGDEAHIQGCSDVSRAAGGSYDTLTVQQACIETASQASQLDDASSCLLAWIARRKMEREI